MNSDKSKDLDKNRKASGRDRSKQCETLRIFQDEYVGAGRIYLGTLYNMSLNPHVHYFMAAFTLLRSLTILQMFPHETQFMKERDCKFTSGCSAFNRVSSTGEIMNCC